MFIIIVPLSLYFSPKMSMTKSLGLDPYPWVLHLGGYRYLLCRKHTLLWLKFHFYIPLSLLSLVLSQLLVKYSDMRIWNVSFSAQSQVLWILSLLRMCKAEVTYFAAITPCSSHVKKNKWTNNRWLAWVCIFSISDFYNTYHLIL